jgi:symplekin
MNAIVVHYALQMVRRLATPAAEEEKEEGMEEGEEVEEKVVSTYVPEVFDMPIRRDLVQQHVELLFALSVRDADLLDE